MRWGPRGSLPCSLARWCPAGTLSAQMVEKFCDLGLEEKGENFCDLGLEEKGAATPEQRWDYKTLLQLHQDKNSGGKMQFR